MALIAGPTASGKSALALALAKRVDAVIINADASQVYTDLSILSARPSSDEMRSAQHRLFGYIDGSQACSAAFWAEDARREINVAHERGQLPILVGGTGLYIRTLLDGIAPVPEIDPHIRALVRSMTTGDAYAALLQEDPVSAARLAPADSTRVARALEVIRSTGHPVHYWHAQNKGGIADTISLSPLLLLPPRDWLNTRCDARFEMMVDCGGIDEVQTLLARDLSPALPVMRAIGVREIASFLQGDIDRPNMLNLGRIATRQYARRQYTWFAHQPPPHWQRITTEINNQESVQMIIKLLE